MRKANEGGAVARRLQRGFKINPKTRLDASQVIDNRPGTLNHLLLTLSHGYPKAEAPPYLYDYIKFPNTRR